MIILDFETRSRVNLLETGSNIYAMDGSTEILCVAMTDLDDGASWSGITLHGQDVLPEEWKARKGSGFESVFRA